MTTESGTPQHESFQPASQPASSPSQKNNFASFQCLIRLRAYQRDDTIHLGPAHNLRWLVMSQGRTGSLLEKHGERRLGAHGIRRIDQSTRERHVFYSIMLLSRFYNQTAGTIPLSCWRISTRLPQLYLSYSSMQNTNNHSNVLVLVPPQPSLVPA